MKAETNNEVKKANEAMREGLEKIREFLTKPGSKFKHFTNNDVIDIGTEKPVHLVKGYSSGFLAVYLDSHNLQMSVSGNGVNGPSSLVVYNSTMVANPDFAISFIKEKQVEHEKAIANIRKK